MNRALIVVLALLLAFFGHAGCKNKKKTGEAASKTGVAHAAPAKAKAKPEAKAAAADEPDETEAGDPEEATGKVTKEATPTGAYAASCQKEPETKDHAEDIPTSVDFEEEAAAKITALNVDAELKLFMAHIYDLKYPNKKK